MRFSRKVPQIDKAARGILIGCSVSVCTLWVALYFVYPAYERVGTALAMVSAILCGIFFTRWQRWKKSR